MTTDIKAASGQIWRANKVCLARHGSLRRAVIEQGELVEFRYWYPANVRTVDDKYLTIDEREFYYSFDYVGKIFEEVRMGNNHTTKQIIENKLYTEPSNG